jgi:ATP-dependent DNA helicase PIF1
MTQDEALDLVKTGTSVFLTGQPGSGKTHTVNRYLQWLRRQGIEYAYTASTGIAATHGHGVTIHAWSGIGVRESLHSRDLDTLAANRRLATRIERTKVLVIDEISMLPARSLSLVNAVCRHIRNAGSPFGGLQIVLVGDFFQLPPVVRRDAKTAMLALADGEDLFGSEFAHTSSAWRDLAPTVCYLSEQHRQSDTAFLDVLAAIRANACAGIHRSCLDARQIGRDGCPRTAHSYERALRVHPQAVEKDAEFRAASEAARSAVGALAGKQAAFLAACQARSQPPKKKRANRPAYPKSYEVAALRETHAKAYAPWTTAEENDLVLRHNQGEPIAAIAASLGRKPGAVRSRLKKLALI